MLKYVNYGLLLFVPVAIISELAGGSPLLVFACAAVGVVPLAGWMGRATEELATYTGPRLGGAAQRNHGQCG
jgi:Ca2+:H+ antiporter